MCCATSVVKEQETWTESWTTGATARLVRSSCGARHTSSNVQLQARTTERDGVRELQGPYLLFIIWLPFQKSPKYQSLPPSPLPKPAPCFLCNKTHCFRKSTNQHQEPIKQFWWLWRQPIWRRKQLYDTILLPFSLIFSVLLISIADSAQTEYCSTFPCLSVCQSQAWHLKFSW